MIINYAEYLMATTGREYPVKPKRETTAEEDADYETRVEEFEKWYMEMNESTPDWFNYWQKRAIALIEKKVAAVYLLPRNRTDYLDLKEEFWIEQGTHIYHREPMNYKILFRDALAEQIQFMHDNEITMKNGFLNAANSINIGGYSQSMTPDNMIKKMFNELAPLANDNLEQMGWMYSGIDSNIDPMVFYKGEK